MKSLYLISAKLGTAVMRYSSTLPFSTIKEDEIVNAIQRIIETKQGLGGFTIAHCNFHTSKWQEISAKGKVEMSEDEVLEKIGTFINSATILNETIINADGVFNLDTDPQIKYLREIGFASVQTSFILNQFGFIDTTIQIGKS